MYRFFSLFFLFIFFPIKQTDTDLCHPNPCANGSPCFNTLGQLGGPDYYCLCQSHWQGKNCSRYRQPPPPPPLPASQPSPREFFFFGFFSSPFFFFFNSIRFIMWQHEAAARSILSRLRALLSFLAVLLGLLFTHRQKAFLFSSFQSFTHEEGLSK